jgi:CubicO group peptidase (beta-lactamase class C family)
VIKKMTCFATAILMAAPISRPQSHNPVVEVMNSLDSVIAKTVAENAVGSVTIGVVVGSSLVWAKSYGDADMERHIQASQDTVYRVGSITKQFTATMLLRLEQAGNVHLSDPVERYFPEVNRIKGRWTGAPPITLFQLATHTAGLAMEPDDLTTYMVGPVSEWENVLIRALEHTSFIYEPGTRYSYSNIGYAILGAALSRAAHESYTEYVTKNILLPLGMVHSVFEPDQETRLNLAKGYAYDEGHIDTQRPEREHRGRGYKVPNGALYTNVGDLSKFLAFEMGFGPQTVLKAQTLEDIHKRVISADLLQNGYGIGFQARSQGDLLLIGHDGDVAGYEAGAYFEPKRKFGVLLFHNSSGDAFDGWKMVVQIVEKLAPALAAAKDSKP